MLRITSRQYRVLEEINHLREELGRSPSGGELAERLELKNRSGVYQILHRMARKGLIRIERTGSNFIHLNILPPGRHYLKSKDNLYDHIPTHRLKPTDVLSELLPSIDPNDMIVRATTASMSGVGIHLGDWLVVRPGVPTRNGAICLVSLSTGVARLRQIYFEGDNIRLATSNPIYPEAVLPGSSVRIHGLLVAKFNVRRVGV
ncbi:MAG: LexA family protein [Candidatus Kapaibacterium sp.]